MKIKENAVIQNSLKLKSRAKYHLLVNSIDDFDELSEFVLSKKLNYFILGEGTNIIPSDFFNGIVIRSKFNNLKLTKNKLECGSSINWHKLVLYAIDNNIYGFENLSLIPGSVGAAPVQNIGAYGSEISNLINSIDCYDIENKKILNLNNFDCKFSYRDSIFKSKKYLIYNINFHINKLKKLNFKYQSLTDYISVNKIDPNEITLRNMSNIICSIRESKLPDPIKLPNAGSFFKNPIVSIETFKKLEKYDIVFWKINNSTFKIGAARLIELIKDELPIINNVGIYDKHSLVITTDGNASFNKLIKYIQLIKNKIFEKFEINLVVEPLILK